MAGPIYKMFRVGPKEAWYQLSKEQQDALFAQMDETFQRVGAKRIIMCDSSWSSEQWLFWGVEEFPSQEAHQEHSKCLSDLNWFRYVDSDILLGTAVPTETT